MKPKFALDPRPTAKGDWILLWVVFFILFGVIPSLSYLI